jgi:hypothetical protein
MAFERSCRSAGLACVGQEQIAWEFGRYLTDVISVCAHGGSRWDRPNVVVANPRFIDEARLSAKPAQLYSLASFPAGASQPATSRISST